MRKWQLVAKRRATIIKKTAAETKQSKAKLSTPESHTQERRRAAKDKPKPSDRINKWFTGGSCFIDEMRPEGSDLTIC